MRRVCAVLSILLALFAASGARHFIPGLKEDTRAVPAKMAKVAAPVRTTIRESVAAQGGGRELVARVRTAAPPRAVPPGLVWVPVAHASEGDALGTGSLPRSARWRALGGHGRNGVG